jgi:seryl-tRNA synthetase
MLTTKYVRDNIDAIRKSLERRKSDYPIDKLLDLDKGWRSAKAELQALQEKQNKASLEISASKKEGADISGMVKALGELKKGIGEREKRLPEMEAEMEKLLWNIPNVLCESVPYGKSEDDNVVIGKWGEIAKKETPGHAEILTKMGLLDIEQASIVSGARFYYLKGDLALLEQSLIRFGIDEMLKRGYTLIAPPMMLKREYYRGVTALGDFEEALYRVGDPNETKNKDGYERIEEDTFLISTSEHPIAALHAGQVIRGRDLPLKYVGVSPCFRREAGSHGKDTKGIFRVHNFYKIEQYVFCKPEDSGRYFDELLSNAKEVYQKLKMPYQVLEFCTGGIGTVAARKNDIEVYLQGQKRYREAVSCSNCTDWQSVRLDIKYDEGGERGYVHTLNSTILATERMLVAIAENYYNSEDGTITVPEALVPYMGKERISR